MWGRDPISVFFYTDNWLSQHHLLKSKLFCQWSNNIFTMLYIEFPHLCESLSRITFYSILQFPIPFITKAVFIFYFFYFIKTDLSNLSLGVTWRFFVICFNIWSLVSFCEVPQRLKQNRERVAEMELNLYINLEEIDLSTVLGCLQYSNPCKWFTSPLSYL